MVPQRDCGQRPVNSAAPEAVASPCVGICRLAPGTMTCEGCLRTAKEIGEWRDAGPARRREIAEAAARRREAASNGTRPGTTIGLGTDRRTT